MVMQYNARGKVPQFSMRPHPVASIAFVFVMIIGILGSLALFYKEDGTGTFKQRGIFILVITIILGICLALVATSKWWHSHLWKRNSTHKRHHQHTRHHPMMKDKEFRRKR